MSNTKKERLEKVFEYLRGIGAIHTKKDFALAIKHNYTNVTSAFNGNEAYLTDGLFEKITNFFPIINAEWLLTGEGEMLQSEHSEPNLNITTMELKTLLKAIEQHGEELRKQGERLDRMLDIIAPIEQSHVG